MQGCNREQKGQKKVSALVEHSFSERKQTPEKIPETEYSARLCQLPKDPGDLGWDQELLKMVEEFLKF